MSAVFLLLVLLGAGTGAPFLSAQTTGTVAGVVLTVTEGRGLVGVRVELILQAAPARSVRTGEDGGFEIRGVPAGTHRIRVRHMGYHALDRAVEVRAGQVVSVRLQLTSTAVDLDTLRVFASPLAIRRGDTEFGSRIERRAIQLLPTPYDPADLVALTPGAAAGRIWGGAADEANLYQVDGVSHTHPGSGGFLVPISPAWLEAVEVRGLGAGAEHGNFQGGIVNAVTRSGSNLREGRFRSSLESAGLNATNLVDGEVGRDRALRSEAEGDAAGPLVRDRLFYFLGGHVLREDVRAQSRLPRVEERFLPYHEERTELRGFGKLTWIPGASDRFDLSAGLVSSRAYNWGLDGFQAADALADRRAPSRFYHAAWRRGGTEDGYLELRASGAGARETIEPPRGVDVPAVRRFAPGDPPTPVFRNAPFQIERKPTTHTLAAELAGTIRTGPWNHQIRAGVETTRSAWMDRQQRAGGLTWRPAGTGELDPDDPSTWFFGGILPSDWGGELDLHSEMWNDAAYIQNYLILHPRFSLSPGFRFGRWRGDLLPGGDRERRMRALETHALEPRVGATIDPLGTNELVIKAHWGRFHQNLLAQFFERADGGEVFNNRELWYYRDTSFPDPATTFTREQRDADSDGSPHFTLEQLIRLNETGRVAADLRQPRVDQWLVGVEKTFGARVRIEALWIERTNRDMIALQDMNLGANYHRYENIRVMRGGQNSGEPPDTLFLGDDPFVLPELYVPLHWIRIILVGIGNNADIPMPPGFTVADTAWLPTELDQDLVLRNVPEAARHLRQIQLGGHVAYPAWGASASLVISRLRGNFNSVSGYEAGTGHEQFAELGAGPFVRPNEQVNFHGRLPGVPPFELKVAVHGELPWALRGGAFVHAARGERFTPYFTLTGLDFQYRNEDEELVDFRLPHAVAGQRMFVRARGAARYPDRATMDLRLERGLPFGSANWRLTADLFNVWNSGAVTRINPSLNHAAGTQRSMFAAVNPSAQFGAVWERIPPRTLRFGITAEF